jgi:hypothetical protein
LRHNRALLEAEVLRRRHQVLAEHKNDHWLVR